MILCVRKRKNSYICTQLGRADDHGTVCSDTDGTDCSASMVPITVLHLVPIQRYQQWSLISSQFVMTSRTKRPKKSLPYAFTELGALMLSSVLRSPVADETSIKITRAFAAMRQMLTFSTLPEKVVTLAQELYKLKEEVNDILADQNDINESTRAQLDAISIALAELQSSKSQIATQKRRPIGFIQPKDEDKS